MYDYGQTTAVHVSIVIDVSPENNRIHHLLNMLVKKLQSMINK